MEHVYAVGWALRPGLCTLNSFMKTTWELLLIIARWREESVGG